jgi:MerR family transcriptional regulator, heat shock protein HspR
MREKKNNKKVVYSISEAAQKLGITARMLREYEKKGLLSVYRDTNGYRFFSKDDIHWIQCIRDLIHEEKISINGIKRLLAFIPCWEIKKCSKEVQAKCMAKIDKTRPCWQNNTKCKNDEKCYTCEVYKTIIDRVKK